MAEEQELGTIMAEEAAFLRRLGSCHACHPPFGWQSLAKPPSSGCALHGSTYSSQHLNAHTPVQWRP